MGRSMSIAISRPAAAVPFAAWRQEALGYAEPVPARAAIEAHRVVAWS
jgi:hypothetical protein